MAKPICGVQALGYRQADMAKPICGVQAIGYRQADMALLKAHIPTFIFKYSKLYLVGSCSCSSCDGIVGRTTGRTGVY